MCSISAVPVALRGPLRTGCRHGRSGAPKGTCWQYWVDDLRWSVVGCDHTVAEEPWWRMTGVREMSDNTQTRRIGSDEQEDNKVHTQILSLSLSHTHTHTTHTHTHIHTHTHTHIHTHTSTHTHTHTHTHTSAHTHTLTHTHTHTYFFLRNHNISTAQLKYFNTLQTL